MVCIDCGDDLVNFIAMKHVDEPDEARMDVIGSNGNDDNDVKTLGECCGV
jgi:hypothetical protein